MEKKNAQGLDLCKFCDKVGADMCDYCDDNDGAGAHICETHTSVVEVDDAEMLLCPTCKKNN